MSLKTLIMNEMTEKLADLKTTRTVEDVVGIMRDALNRQPIGSPPSLFTGSGVLTLYEMETWFHDPRRFLRSGGVEVLLDAMRHNRLETTTQIISLIIINWMLNSYEGNYSEQIGADVAETIVDNGGVHEVMAVMGVNIYDERVQSEGLDFISSLINPNENSDVGVAEVIAGGGIAAVVEAMNAHVGNFEIEERCLGILRSLCSVGQDAIILMYEYGAVVSVIRAMGTPSRPASYA